MCVADCPEDYDYEAFFCRYPDQAAADADVQDGYELVGNFKCMYQIKTKDFLNRCLPDMDTAVAASDAQSASNGTLTTEVFYETGKSGKEWFNNFLSDVLTLQGYIFGFGIGFATGLAFLYLYLLRIPGLLFFFIWTAVLSVLILLLIGSILLLTLANTWSQDGEHSNPEVYTMRFFGYFGLAVTAIYLCLVLVMRKRIQLAIGIVKQAAKALATMPALLALPVLQAIGLLIFIIPWIIYVLFLASSGTITTVASTYEYNGTTFPYSYREFEFTTNTKYAFLYMIFCYFWTSEFILAFGQLAIALSFTGWYFVRDKRTAGNSTVLWVSVCPTSCFNSLFGDAFVTFDLTLCSYTVNCLAQFPQPSLSRILTYSDKSSYQHIFPTPTPSSIRTGNQDDVLAPPGHGGARLSDHCDYQDHPDGDRLHPEAGQEEQEQGEGWCRGVLWSTLLQAGGTCTSLVHFW